MDSTQRRRLLHYSAATFASLGLLRGALAQQRPLRPAVAPQMQPTEELMHQHGVLRRAVRLFVLGAERIDAGQPFPKPVIGAALLYREFGSLHHEQQLEESYVFPDLVRIDPVWQRPTEILIEQHRRGREIIDFMIVTAGRGPVSADDVAPLVQSLRAYHAMYEYHTAVEESLLFPTWKAAVDERRFALLQQAFERVAELQYGREGLAGAVKQVAALEQQLGVRDLAAMTPALPRQR